MEFLILLIGLAFGSFANVIIGRLKIEEDGLNRLEGKKYSHCQSCGERLVWCDLIPVVSYLFLRGRCRYCQAKIPAYLPIVEILTGMLAVLIYWNFGMSIQALGYFLIAVGFVIIFFYDLSHQLIPDSVLLVVFVVSLVLKSWLVLLQGYGLIYPDLVLGTAICALPLLILYLVSKGRWIGFGDVKLAAVIGFILPSAALALASLWLGFVLGGLVGAGMILLGRKKLSSRIALGPFLIVGFFTTLLLQNPITQIINLYYL